MFFFHSLRRRQREPEIMDDPALEAARHLQALDGLERINRWSRSAGILWTPIREWVRPRSSPARAWRVLDIATGGGDVPIALWHKARRAGLPLQIDGCDISPRAVEYAQQKAAQSGAKVNFFVHDALANDLPADYDILTSSLFLHHLDEDEAIGLLQKMKRATRGLALVNDLTRSTAGWLLAYCGTRWLTSCDVVHVDGPRSVRAALTIPEARALAARAGLDGARVSRRWPFRYLLRWSRTP